MAAYRQTHVTCRLTAKNRDQLRIPMLGNRARATYIFKMVDGRHFGRPLSIDICTALATYIVDMAARIVGQATEAAAAAA